MYGWNDPDDRVAIAQMNADLRHAQLDLLSAQCATDQLRLRFSVEDLTRYGEKDILRKTIGAAVALSDYYLSIQKELPAESAKLNEQQLLEAVKRVAEYLWERRQDYIRAALPLSAQHKTLLRPFFSGALLDRVQIVELHGQRIPPPPFYMEARAMGITNLPSLTHMASLTFLDVVVFNDKLIDRALFHALVHTAQFEILGLERYTNLFVRGFFRTSAHFTVPLESHAFALESRFVRDPDQPFSVEEQVRLWMREGRY